MMRLPLFRYVAPGSIEEAVQILGRDPNETMVLERTPRGWRIAHIHWSSRRK